MYKKYQKYFKEDNIIITLKYDGERTKNKYSIIIHYSYDVDYSKELKKNQTKEEKEKFLNSFKKNYRIDTDQLEQTFWDLLKSIDIEIEDNIFLDNFKIIEDIIFEICKINIVFLLSIEKTNQIIFKLSLLLPGKTITIIKNSVDEILAELKLNNNF